ncbi:MAG TPA: GtrA family protein [Thermoanaerobaculia bacterium]|nr:GtrA family protein [Thermoanaerobaculia bacterium]
MFPEGSAARPAETPGPASLATGSRPGLRAAARVRSLLRIRFVRFLLVAALNTVFGYSLFAALILLGIHYPIAAAIGTVTGILFNFQTTGRLVFERHDLSLLLRFFAVYGISYVVGVSLLRWADHHGISVLVAAAVLAVPMGFFSYTLQRLLVFRRPR